MAEMKKENAKTKMTTKEVCFQGLLIALVTLSTMMFRIPVSATQGYIHLGDSMILIIGVFFGARYGAVAGGVGSALADILSGYAHWAVFTFIIKAIMGYVIGKTASFCTQNESFFTIRNMLSGILGIIWMVIGYFFGGAVLKSSFAVAALSIPENMVQGVAGFIIFIVVGIAFSKAKIYRLVPNRQ